MKGTTIAWRRLAFALGLGVAALVLGSVFGRPGESVAAAAAAPTNTGTPTITGTTQEGQTLTATDGTWTNSPTSYDYAWSRCDQNGDSCSAIAGNDIKTYKLISADVGKTLRITVTVKNADGSASATSAPTAVVSSAAAPTNTAAPTITGSAAVGSTLTASSGTWGNDPTSFSYAWSRCDETGSACSTVGGATANTYALKQVDAGVTLRVVVTATNSTGSTSTTSVPTAVVTTPSTPPATGCPAGTGVIQASGLTAPARLAVDNWLVTPGLVTPSASSIQFRIHISACSGRAVQGAQVFAVPVPYNQFKGATVATDATGWATLTESRQSGFPATPRQELLAVVVQVTKPGESVLKGVSTTRIVVFPASARG